MSVRRMTSYRLLLVRSGLARFGRALAYYWLSLRTAVRTWLTSYQVTMVRYRVRAAASATGRALYRLPRTAGSLLVLPAWFFGQLPPYLARVLAERREDRAELLAERRLAAAARRARRAQRGAELAGITAGREKRPHNLPVPAWISRMERPVRTAGPRRLPALRMAMVAAAVTLAAGVPTYAVLSGAIGSDDAVRATPEALASDGAGAPSAIAQPGLTSKPGPKAPGFAASGDTGGLAQPLPPIPTPAPAIPAPGLQAPNATSPGATTGSPAGMPGAAAPGTAAAGTDSVSQATVAASLRRPLSAHQQREARRQAKWQAKQARFAEELAKDGGK